MRIGFFGGTFDPPHVGHLLVAIDAVEALELDKLLLIPAHAQPLKRERGGKASTTVATPAHRLEMITLAVKPYPRLAVDPIEIERGGLSYTVDTLVAEAERYPRAERFFLVGADSLGTFDQWREPEKVLELARLVVLRRGVETPVVRTAVAGWDPVYLDTRRVDVSSTEVRARVRDGKTIRGFVPDAVAAYIARVELYRTGDRKTHRKTE